MPLDEQTMLLILAANTNMVIFLTADGEIEPNSAVKNLIQ